MSGAVVVTSVYVLKLLLVLQMVLLDLMKQLIHVMKLLLLQREKMAHPMRSTWWSASCGCNCMELIHDNQFQVLTVDVRMIDTHVRQDILVLVHPSNRCEWRCARERRHTLIQEGVWCGVSNW